MIEIGATPVAVQCYVCDFGNICSRIRNDDTLNHSAEVSFGVLVIEQIIARSYVVLRRRFPEYSGKLSGDTASEIIINQSRRPQWQTI